MSLHIAEHAERTDPGRSRRGNEDSLWVAPPFFVVADGMGGAQAGEVASGTAVEVLAAGLPGDGTAEEGLVAAVRAANERIHELSRTDRARAGMGTTLIAAAVGEEDVTLAHVGDSRIYRLRGGALTPLTRDHTLVQALIDQGRISEEEAATHPQRSVITRALGPEPDVDVETHTIPARGGDVFLLCSDGLTSMVDEPTVSRIIASSGSLDQAAGALVDAANAAGGRDNITVVLFRVTEDGEGGAPGGPASGDTAIFKVPSQPARTPRRRRRGLTALRRTGIVLVILLPILVGVWVATRNVYFVGTNAEGLVAIYRGVPYDLPAGIRLYERFYVSGVPASTVPVKRREQLLDHSLRSQKDASDLVDQLELGKIER